MLDLNELKERLSKEYSDVRFGYNHAPVEDGDAPDDVTIRPFKEADVAFVIEPDFMCYIQNVDSETFKATATNIYMKPIKDVDEAISLLHKAIEKYKKKNQDFYKETIDACENFDPNMVAANNLIFRKKWRKEMDIE